MAALVTLMLGSPQLDERRRAVRMASVLYLGGAHVVAATLWFAPSHVDRTAGLLAAVAAVLIALMIQILPWEKWSSKALRWLSALGVVVVMVGGGYIANGLEFYVPLLILVYVWAGMFLPSGSSVWLMFISVAMFLVALTGKQTASATPIFLVTMLIAIPLGELLALVKARERRSVEGFQRLLDAGISLGAATSEAEAAGVLAKLTTQLLQADGGCVLLAEEPGSSDFTRFAQHGSVAFPARVNARGPAAAPLVEALRAGRSTHADLTCLIGGRRRAIDAVRDGAVFLVPLRGRTGALGALVGGWRNAQPNVDQFSQYLTELLAAEAANVLDGLRRTERLARQACIDELTGLVNRRMLTERLERVTAGDVLVLLDLDHFKQVNDTHGHAAGDAVLKAFAACLERIARNTDTLARFGGEEFALVLTGTREEGVRDLLRRLRADWAATSSLTTFSAGMAVCTASDGPGLLFDRADAALYRAKRSGRNCDVVDDPSLDDPTLGPIQEPVAIPVPLVDAEHSVHTGG